MTTAVVFVGAVALLAIAGSWVFRIPFVRGLDWPAGLAAAFAAGTLGMTLLMFAMSVSGLRWWGGTLLVAFVALGSAGTGNGPAAPRAPIPRLFLAALAIPAGITLWAVLDARETCGDLLYFWGPKAVRFLQSGRIDVAFLAFPHYYTMHPDYPPLLPLAYVWGGTAAGTFTQWGALLCTPLFLLATAAGFRGIAATRISSAAATAHALLLAVLLAHGFAASIGAGAAEPPLLFFETVALAALTFADRDRGALVIGAIALAAAVLTKVEGAAFAAIAILAFAVTTRRAREAILVAAAPLLCLGSWLLFARHHQLLDSYANRRDAFNPSLLGTVLRLTARRARYDAFYLPWVAAIAPLGFGRQWRRAALPLLTAAGSAAAAVFFYLRGTDPAFWIASSAERVLLTPLMALVVASAAASD